MQGALNIAVDVLSKKDQAMEAILLAYREKVDKLEEELALCKTALRYFEAVGITEDAVKLRTVPLYLGDVATVWWRRRCEDIKKGTCTISTWGEFTKELKRQFYPENAESEARAKLRRLQHKEGAIREGVQDLATAMAAAESLIEFKGRSPARIRERSQTEATKPEVETSPSRARTTGGTKGRGTRLRRKKVSLLEPNLLASSVMGLIEHLSAQRGKLAALVSEETEPSEERHVASLQLLVQSRPRLRDKTKAECW
ncbi:hypothetical protein GH714_036965 [Hevea brasiliensis]|uniref:Retrotransposon gag domain-containing protein n=1 Tax=Hevea brasiliensis TaxID=3981 RepID=A0A6A6MM70_HEVBR|nr:hypothetical protein GH714_036965 [Hevea brasiliensis]